MIQDKFGQHIYSQADVFDLLMQGHTLESLSGMTVDFNVDHNVWPDFLHVRPDFLPVQELECSAAEFHQQQQSRWHMPDEYKDLDIASHVLSLCSTQEELQRCGQELLLYQEKNLFDLLRYLKYLVDVMIKNDIIWGVGRGSSVASFVLYKMGIHRINSLYYNLDIHEFLR